MAFQPKEHRKLSATEQNVMQVSNSCSQPRGEGLDGEDTYRGPLADSTHACRHLPPESGTEALPVEHAG